MENPRKVKILFVCLGNICRSPLAENIFRRQVRAARLEEYFEIDSAGTGNWHVGEPPDQRMTQTARGRGLALEGAARQFAARDLSHYDHVFVMDKNNLHDVLYFDQEERHNGKVRLFREFDPKPDDFQVPDPYYGGTEGFENVYDIVERTSKRLLDRLIEEYDLDAEIKERTTRTRSATDASNGGRDEHHA